MTATAPSHRVTAGPGRASSAVPSAQDALHADKVLEEAHTGGAVAVAPDAGVTLPPPLPWWRRLGKHPYLMHYHRLFVLVGMVNMGVLFWMLQQGAWPLSNPALLPQLANLVLGNFAVAILIRQQYVINALFWIATRAPTHWPLSVRWTLGKVYHFGGLHSGCATAGSLWFATYAVAFAWGFAQGNVEAPAAVLAINGTMLGLMVLMLCSAFPPVRARFHNLFEVIHRFAGWTLLVLFWIQSLMLTHAQAPAGDALATWLRSPQPWVLALLTFSVALPWLRLRKVPVEMSKPSNHAVLVRFDHGVTPFAGSSTPVSRSPLREWHSFANVPAPGQSGFRLTISRAGDWTGRFIDDCPSHVWVRGIPTAGVGNIDQLFKRVVWVATGSGIGPCLPHLLAQEVPARLVWSTRSPRETYGDDLVEDILAVQPNAVIWNTQLQGKPDMLKLAYQAYVAFDAEAVICISNNKLTWQVVHGLERLGIPAFGAIWDS